MALGQLEIVHAFQAIALAVRLETFVYGRLACTTDESIARYAGNAGIIGEYALAIEGDTEIALKVETEDAGIAARNETETLTAGYGIAYAIVQEKTIQTMKASRARRVNDRAIRNRNSYAGTSREEVSSWACRLRDQNAEILAIHKGKVVSRSASEANILIVIGEATVCYTALLLLHKSRQTFNASR